jgi:hypothetical protein
MWNYLILFFYVIFVCTDTGISTSIVSCFNAGTMFTGPFDSTSICSIPVAESKCNPLTKPVYWTVKAK